MRVPETDRLRKRHEDHYGGRGETIDMQDCWYCQREVAVCRYKQVFNTPRNAHEYAIFVNEAGILDRLVAPYACSVCNLWHVTSKVNKTRAKRWEKARRKVLHRNALTTVT